MDYKLLGKTGIKVSELCLGTMTFGTDWNFGSDKEESQRVFDAFVNTARQVGNTIKTLESDFNTNMVTTNKDGSIIAVSSEEGFVRVYKNIEGTWTQLGSVISEEYSSSDFGDWKLSMNNDGTRI